MAYKPTNLTPISSNASPSCIREWSFWNEDGDTVTAAGFFPNACGVKNNDLVKVLQADSGDLPAYYKATVAATGTITLSASA